jgi:hypothetical protein
MGLSVRVWRRVKDSLIAIGKIILRSGCLTNMRFEKERKARAEQLRKQSEGMRKRWQNERAAKAANDGVSPKFQESLAEVSLKLSENLDEKPNEINGSNDSQLLIDRERERKKEDSDPNGSGAEAPERPLREVIWDEGLKWIRKRTMVREEKLRPRVGSWIKDYGEAAVMNALGAAQQKSPVDAMSYIEGCLKRQGRTNVNGITDLKPWELEQQETDQRTSDALENLKKKYANGYVTP